MTFLASQFLIISSNTLQTRPALVQPPTAIQKEFQRLSRFDAEQVALESVFTPHNDSLFLREACLRAEPDTGTSVPLLIIWKRFRHRACLEPAARVDPDWQIVAILLVLKESMQIRGEI
jgi:hypothetical protein